MENAGIVFAVLLLVVTTLLLWATSGTLPSVGRRRTQSFWCPFRERNVTTEFALDAWGDRPFEVSSCTAFIPERDVVCDKPCLRMPSLPALKGPLSLAAISHERLMRREGGAP